MHFYNTEGTHCPLPLPPITLCPDLSQLSQHLPAAQGVAVNQVSLELSRSRGWISLSCMEQEHLVLSILFFLPVADVHLKPWHHQLWVWALLLLFDAVACVCLFTVHSLVKESLIKGQLCKWRSEGADFHHPAVLFRISRSYLTLSRCDHLPSKCKWDLICEIQVITHFLPWKTEKACGDHSSTCAEVVVTLKPGGCHMRPMPHADGSFTPHLRAHISWEQGKYPAQLGKPGSSLPWTAAAT